MRFEWLIRKIPNWVHLNAHNNLKDSVGESLSNGLYLLESQ